MQLRLGYQGGNIHNEVVVMGMRDSFLALVQWYFELPFPTKFSVFFVTSTIKL